MKKILSLVFFMLVICSAIVPPSSTAQSTTMSQPLTRGNILYVGGSGPNNYTKIQDAIDAASNGDTVYVYDDSSPYAESLIVNKSIRLVGENRETTTIQGPEDSTVVKLMADNITMNGFTVIIPSSPSTWGMGIAISKMSQWPSDKDEIIQNVTVFDTTIVTENPNSSGISCLYCNQGNISDNYITGCYDGIQLFLSSSDTVSHNVVEHSNMGISVRNTWNPRYHLWFVHPQFGHNIISGNIVRNNKIGILIDGDRTTNDKILENNITDNEKGIVFGTALKSEIARNNFVGNNLSASIFTTNLFFYPTNSWHDNYWGEPKKFPVPIFGRFWFLIMYNTHFKETNFGSAIPLGQYPVITFDRTPAQAPYTIEK